MVSRLLVVAVIGVVVYNLAVYGAPELQVLGLVLGLVVGLGPVSRISDEKGPSCGPEGEEG